MASLRIPERYRPGFAVLAGLSDRSFEEFLAAAKRAPKSFASVREFAVWIEPEVKAIPSEDVQKLVSSISSFYRFASKRGKAIPRLATELFEAAQTSNSNIKIVDGVDFPGRLAALLSVESFDIVAFKARELQEESERTFCEARVLTDIRPVFGEKIEDIPSGMIVVHTLKLVFHELSGHREIFLALDDADIASLKKTLDRAEEKTRSLKALFTQKEIRSIDLP